MKNWMEKGKYNKVNGNIWKVLKGNIEIRKKYYLKCK